MFECGNKACVSPIVVCNGHDDCGNGADETLCAVRQCAPFQFRFVLICLFVSKTSLSGTLGRLLRKDKVDDSEKIVV